jgi:hypothetical protein
MDFSDLHNYYERLVFNYISNELVDRYPEQNDDYFLDVAAFSLGRLPARYIRHEIDMIYYLDPAELDRIHQQVADVVDEAAELINQRKRDD